MRILALCGSLRRQSANRALLEALVGLAPAGVAVHLHPSLGLMPAFSPDDDLDPLPATVAALRHAIADADGVVLAVPEYAHGVPGMLKNALDWLVSGSEVIGKPFVLFNVTPRSVFAQAQLAETLRVMSTDFLEACCITLPPRAPILAPDLIASDRDLAALLVGGLEGFAAAIRMRRER